MKKLLKSKKALSPVVAAIILIAVTVAVSIAVAAWMGSLTIGFMTTEEMRITNAVFTDSGVPDTDTLVVTVLNTGTTDITIVDVTVTGPGVTGATLVPIPTEVPVSDLTDGVAITLGGTFTVGNSYTIELLTSQGNIFSYRATA